MLSSACLEKQCSRMEHKQSSLLPLTSLAEDLGHPPALCEGNRAFRIYWSNASLREGALSPVPPGIPDGGRQPHAWWQITVLEAPPFFSALSQVGRARLRGDLMDPGVLPIFLYPQ